MVGEPSGKRSNVFIGYFKRVEGSKKIGTDNACGRTLGEFLEGNHENSARFRLARFTSVATSSIRNYVANGFYTIFHHGWFLYKEGIAIYIYTRLEGRRRECTRLTGRWLKETRMYEKRNRA